jgi:hypothetical protein
LAIAWFNNQLRKIIRRELFAGTAGAAQSESTTVHGGNGAAVMVFGAGALS